MSDFYSHNGVFIVKDIQFTGTPGSDYKIKFFTDAIDMNKPSNKEIL